MSFCAKIQGFGAFDWRKHRILDHFFLKTWVYTRINRRFWTFLKNWHFVSWEQEIQKKTRFSKKSLCILVRKRESFQIFYKFWIKNSKFLRLRAEENVDIQWSFGHFEVTENSDFKKNLKIELECKNFENWTPGFTEGNGSFEMSNWKI